MGELASGDCQECSFRDVSFERMTRYPSGDVEFDVLVWSSGKSSDSGHHQH